MKKLSLYKITEELLETSEKLVSSLTEFVPLEMGYQKARGELQLTSKRGNALDRVEEANTLIMENPIYEKYQAKKLEIKALYIHFDALKLAVKSLQSLSYGGEL